MNPHRRVLAVILCLAGLTAAVAADGTWQPQSIDVSISNDDTAIWRDGITFTPSFSILPGNVLSIRFGGKAAATSTTKACINAGGADGCLEKWRYPEQHITLIQVTFDHGGVMTSKPLGLTDGGHVEFTVPAGATLITHMEATVGDVGDNMAHDSHGTSAAVTRRPGTVTFPDTLRLSDGARVSAGAPATGTGGSKWPWYAAAAAAALAALTVARRRRTRGLGLGATNSVADALGPGISRMGDQPGAPASVALGAVGTAVQAVGRLYDVDKPPSKPTPSEPGT
jgi:MYXO-CTERM domain-containing protein